MKIFFAIISALIVFIGTVVLFFGHIDKYKECASVDPATLTQQYVDEINTDYSVYGDSAAAKEQEAVAAAKQEALDDISAGKKLLATSNALLMTKTLTTAAILAVLGFCAYYLWYFIVRITTKPLESVLDSPVNNFFRFYITPVAATSVVGFLIAYGLAHLLLTGTTSEDFSSKSGSSVEDAEDLREGLAEASVEQAAEQEDALTQHDPGFADANGKSVDKDAREAVKAYRKAAEQGDARAQNELGICYFNGEGVERNHKEAAKWFRKAAEQGHAPAQKNLGWYYANGQGVEVDHKEAAKWYLKAAEQGHVHGQFEIGVCYRRGVGVERNDKEAVRWLQKAAEQGHAATGPFLDQKAYRMGDKTLQLASEVGLDTHVNLLIAPDVKQLEQALQLVQYGYPNYYITMGRHLDSQDFNRFIANRIIVQQAIKDMNISVSDEDVTNAIKTSQRFAPDGKFNDLAYATFIDKRLGKLGLTEKDLRELVREGICLIKLIAIIARDHPAEGSKDQNQNMIHSFMNWRDKQQGTGLER